MYSFCRSRAYEHLFDLRTRCIPGSMGRSLARTCPAVMYVVNATVFCFALFSLPFSKSYIFPIRFLWLGLSSQHCDCIMFLHLAVAFLNRGREVKKSGGGGRNWGNDNAADIDSAAANTNDGEGAGWGANGAAAPSAEVGFGVGVGF